MKKLIRSRSTWEFVFSGTQALSAAIVTTLTVYGLVFTDAPKLLIEALRAEKSEAILEKNVALQETAAAKQELNQVLEALDIQKENLLRAQEYSRSYFKEVRQILTADLHQKLLERTNLLRSQLIATRDYPIFEKYSFYIQSIPATVAARKKRHEETFYAWETWQMKASALRQKLSEQGVNHDEIIRKIRHELGPVPEYSSGWGFSQVEEFRNWPGKTVPQLWEAIAYKHFNIDGQTDNIAREMQKTYLAEIPQLNDQRVTGASIVQELFTDRNLEALTNEHKSNVLKLLKDFKRQHQLILDTTLMVPRTRKSEPLWVSEMQYASELQLASLDQFEQLAVNFILSLDNELV